MSVPRVTFTGATAGDPMVVNCELSGPVIWLPPAPKISTTDRPGAIGLTQWDGQDPYEGLFPIRLDGFPGTGVENRIKTLEGLAEVQGSDNEPPVVTISGDVPLPHPNLAWRIKTFDEPTELLFLRDAKTRARYATTVHVIQRVTDTYLQSSLAPTKSKGLTVRTWKVRASESSLTDVARDAYHDPSRAGDIATANGLHLGAALKTNQVLKLP